jgi:hygromycin-B 7''-O-kinase
MAHPLDQLSTIDGYRARFTDAAFWHPYVQEVCRRHNLVPCETLRLGVVGSSPVFIVEERWLVKFYGKLFNGVEAFDVERAAAVLLREHPAFPVPELLAEGALEPPGADWHWPYLIYAFVEGVSIGEVYEQVSFEEKLRLTRRMAEYTRALHRLPIPPGGPFTLDFSSYLRGLESRLPGRTENHAAWKTIPARLHAKIPAFLSPIAELVLPGEQPHLIHADLTTDHLLGRLQDGRWTTHAVIDFGDAFTGGLLYELTALHLGLFASDRQLLAAFLESYGYSGPTGMDFARRALSCCLLHQFDVLNGLMYHSDILQAGSLDELAERLWLI